MAATKKIQVGVRPKYKSINKSVHVKLKAMARAGASMRALMAEVGLQQKYVASQYGFRPGDVAYILELGRWPPRGLVSQNVARALCRELGLKPHIVWDDAPEE